MTKLNFRRGIPCRKKIREGGSEGETMGEPKSIKKIVIWMKDDERGTVMSEGKG